MGGGRVGIRLYYGDDFYAHKKGLIVRYFRPNMSEKGQVLLSRSIIAIAMFIAIPISLTMGGIVATLMRLLAMLAPMAIMMILVVYIPQHTRKSTGPAVMMVGCIYAALEISILPQLILGGQPIYAVLVVSIVTWIATLIFDKRPADYRILYEGRSRQNDDAGTGKRRIKKDCTRFIKSQCFEPKEGAKGSLFE